MNKVLFVLLFVFSLQSYQAQDQDSISNVEFIDSLSTEYRKGMLPVDSILKHNIVTENTAYPKTFKPNIGSRYKGQEFDYSTSKPRESFFAKLNRKLSRFLRNIFGETSIVKSAKITEAIIKLFAIVLVGFLLYIIIKYIIGKDGNFLFGKKNNKVIIKEEELHENIHEINFSESILAFEKAGDYRSAIRYQFLYILKKMSDKKLINWNPEKTNKDYVKELKAVDLQSDFSNLSYIFDYVWYGEFSINEESYNKFKIQYQSFKL